MPSIDGASIRKILDSRGNATIEVEIRVGSLTGRAAAPSGASTGAHEPKALPDGGVEEAMRIFRESVGPGIKGREVSDQAGLDRTLRDRKSTRLNSSHLVISYAVFCLKKKKCNIEWAYR